GVTWVFMPVVMLIGIFVFASNPEYQVSWIKWVGFTALIAAFLRFGVSTLLYMGLLRSLEEKVTQGTDFGYYATKAVYGLELFYLILLVAVKVGLFS
ncbi:hypothetical protein KAZ57_01160, partial [Patescibacteria group bacterium]|nr:hypothetical protein [Patescibacteria group bacterium]